MAQVFEIYKTYKNLSMTDGYDWDEQIEELAKNDIEEKNALLTLFKKETDLDDKLILANILAKLDCQNITPFLLETLQSPKVGDRYSAATILIKLNNTLGSKTLFDIAQKPDIIPSDWFVCELLETNNNMAKTTLFELCQRFPHIKKEFEHIMNCKKQSSSDQ